jgi:hypothetical protein
MLIGSSYCICCTDVASERDGGIGLSGVSRR